MEATATATTPTTPPASSTTRSQIAGKFDDFLLLLTTQLENQDPLNPLESTEFVAQLVSFTEVEQSINTNAHLEKLVAMLGTNQQTAAVGYLGKTVEAKGDTAMLREGQAHFTYSLPRQAASASLTVTDASGKVVFSGPAKLTAGAHDFVWDGRDANGILQPEGAYRIAVKAKDSAGATVPVSSTVMGRVVGVEQTSNGIFLDVDGTVVPLGDILAVREPAPAAGSDS